MSSSRNNDLQQVEKNSNQSPAKIVLQEPLGITRKELDIVYLTAQIAASCGMHFEQELMRSVSMNPEFEPMFQFMNPTDSRRGFFDEVTLEYTRRLPPPSQYTSGGPSPSIATVLEIFFNIVRHVLDHKEEEVTKMDFTYFNDTDCFKPSQWLPPVPGLPYQRFSVNDMKFAVGGLDAYRDCEWYDWAVSKRKEYNDYLLLRKTEYNLQFPAEEPIPMRLGLGHVPSTIKDDSDHSASLKENMSNVRAGETLTP